MTSIHRTVDQSELSFRDLLHATFTAAHLSPRTLERGECQSSDSRRCPLCYAVALDYEHEAQLKNRALQEFWQRRVPQVRLAPLVISPRGRAYRTVTKRRAFASRSGITLGLIDPAENGHITPFSVVRCAIEPEDHAQIYVHIQDFLNDPHSAPLSEVLSYVIVKGNYTEYIVLFNVRRITAGLVKTCNSLSKSLTRRYAHISGIFLHEGRAKSGHPSEYYLEPGTGQAQKRFRRIYGERFLYQKILGRTFLYSPLSFSQVNQSLVDLLITHAGELLELRNDQTLYDLYCGYGPFGLCLAQKVRSVLGAELSAESVGSAIANAQRLRVPNARFIRREITAQSLRSIMMSASSNDAVILDPPRGGTSAGVIESIAVRCIGAVLHIFCNLDLLRSELLRWKKGGYTATAAVPFDMFPGTPEMEVMVLLKPGHQG